MAMIEFDNVMRINNGDLDDAYRRAHNELVNSMLNSASPYDGTATVVVRANNSGEPVVREESHSGLTDPQIALFNNLVDAAKAAVKGSKERMRAKSQIMVEK